MKKVIFIFMISVMVMSCAPRSQYIVNGTLSGVEDQKIYLEKRVDQDYIKVDSAEVSQGMFTFAGTIEYPQVRSIFLKSDQVRELFFLENGKINVSGTTDAVKFSGGKAQADWNTFNEMNKTFSDEQDKLYEDYKSATRAGDKLQMAQIDSLYGKSENTQKACIVSFAAERNKSYFSPYIINRNAYLFDLNELRPVFEAFSTELDISDDYQALKERVQILERVDIGKPFIDFTQNSPENKPISVSQFTGKLLLIDFWASWCRPCRMENPNVAVLYADYKNKGFEILGVSFDTSKEDWLKALFDDGITWAQVSDLSGWNNAAGELYGVRAIPHTVLIDPAGIIIARNLRGKDLREKVASELEP